MYIICSDLEGIFTPEVWINVAEKTGIKELRLTTRDISDYDLLMSKRLAILKKNGVTLYDIQEVITSMNLLDGALEFLNWMRERTQVILVSDTFSEFAGPFMKKLKYPTLFCHNLTVDPEGSISTYNLRQERGKQKTVLALKSLKYKVVAIGDSYNDIDMLKEADRGFLFNPPTNVKEEFPEFTVSENYEELKILIDSIIS